MRLVVGGFGIIMVERIRDDWARKGCLYMIFNRNTVAGDFKIKPMSMAWVSEVG